MRLPSRVRGQADRQARYGSGQYLVSPIDWFTKGNVQPGLGWDIINVNIDTNEFHSAEKSFQLAGKSRRNFGPNMYLGAQSPSQSAVLAATHSLTA